MAWSCVRQSDSNDCGPSCVATLAKSHGMYLSLSRARELVGPDRIGAGLQALREAAERLGFSARCGKGKSEVLAQIALAATGRVGSSRGAGAGYCSWRSPAQALLRRFR